MNKLRVLKIWPAFAILSLVLIFSSCGKEKDPVDDREQFVSTYNVEETYIVSGTTYKDNYSISITKSTEDQATIIISNFAGINITIRASVSGNSFSIPQQTAQGIGFSGSGTISGSSILFSYQESITGKGTWNVSAAGSKM